MKVIKTPLAGVLLLEPGVFGDSRGFFYESFNARTFAEAIGHDVAFVQDNHSRSARHVLRGLHYQRPPHAQGKLVRCTAGEVFDVAVDLRPDSPSYRQWFGAHLSAGNHHQLWIPPGLAHGFLVLSEFAEFLYKTTTFYAPEYECAIAWNDPALAIDWPLDGTPPSLSVKDANAPQLKDAPAAV